MNLHTHFAQSTPPEILIVDQDQLYLDETMAILSAAGFTCRGCTTIEAAILAVDAHRPDLVITALHVNGVAGAEIGRHIRETLDAAEIPLMFVCPKQVPDIIRRREEGRGTYYIRRLLDGNVLVELVERMLPAAALSPAN
jgi:DNA-binding response OmpR family regulator